METKLSKKDFETLEHALQVLNLTVTNDGRYYHGRDIRYQAADAAAEVREIVENFRMDLEDCGGCGCMHYKDFVGDCRNDEERY